MPESIPTPEPLKEKDRVRFRKTAPDQLVETLEEETKTAKGQGREIVFVVDRISRNESSNEPPTAYLLTLEDYELLETHPTIAPMIRQTKGLPKYSVSVLHLERSRK